MKEKVNNNEYKSIDEFTSDINLLVDNCLKFNVDNLVNQAIRNSAQLLLKVYTHDWLPTLIETVEGTVIVIAVLLVL